MKNSILILFVLLGILCGCKSNNLSKHVLVNKRVLYELNVLESALEIDVRAFEKTPTSEFLLKPENAEMLAIIQKNQPNVEKRIVERLKESADSYEICNELIKGLKLHLESFLEFREYSDNETPQDYKFQVTIETIELVRKKDDWYINLRAKSQLSYQKEDEIIWTNREYRFVPLSKNNLNFSTNGNENIKANLQSDDIQQLNKEQLKNLINEASFQSGLEIGETFRSDYLKVHQSIN